MDCKNKNFSDLYFNQEFNKIYSNRLKSTFNNPFLDR